MKKLLSLPPNLVDSFHNITKFDKEEWFCTSDPINERLGSGGGTVWLLDQCCLEEGSEGVKEEWISKEKRILLHAGGQSRRLPSYAPSGKILTPIPVFRWARGQKMSQNLLSLQIPLYEEIMDKAPASLHTLIASGDIYLRKTEPLQEIPEADIVCYGLWVDPSLATNHGVFVSNRNTPEKLDFMLQKPSLEKLGELSLTHLFLMDIGVWLLSDKAINLLKSRSYDKQTDSYNEYDLYSEFGLTLGDNPVNKDKELNELTVAILPLPGGEFYHYGTSKELISSTLSIQNLVRDQRSIMQHKVKPHPAMFVQNADVRCELKKDNSELWIENSVVGKKWQLNNKHIITGVPDNDWHIHLGAGICIDIVPIGEKMFAVRPYGFDDPFKGSVSKDDTVFLGKSFCSWCKEREINMEKTDADIQNALIFPLCENTEEIGLVLKWMISDSDLKEGERIWKEAEKISANQISDKANLDRLFTQRETLKKKNWSQLAANHQKSIFYQLDLLDAANEFSSLDIPLPQEINEAEPVMKRIHDHMFRSKVLQLKGTDNFKEEETKAFSLLRNELIETVSHEKQTPKLNVYPDQIVWSRSPVRIDLAGGWTDTPPFCMYAGGNVVNLAIELNGQPPLQVYVKPNNEYNIVLRSIDMGAREVITTWDELTDYKKIGSPFSIPKAALSLVGFSPKFSNHIYSSLQEQLKEFGSGIEITLLAAIPAGSGLGTSSILAATVLGALSDFCGLCWDKNKIGSRTLILEQLLTTGGGWQDQYGGLLHGLKLLQTSEGLIQSPSVRWLPEYIFTEEYKPCHLLYYTGITRTAKDILAEIVKGMFLNSGKHLDLLNKMKEHALDMYDVIQRGDFNSYGELVKKTWEQNKALDKGTNPPAIEHLISSIHDYSLGYKLPGAGGGGYLYIVAKDPEAALLIKNKLNTIATHPNARFVDMNLSEKGLQTSRS